MKTMLAPAAAAVGLAFACTPVSKAPSQTPGVSYVDYLQIDDTYGLIGHVKKTRLAVCLEGSDPSDVPTWSKNIQSVVLKWVEPLRGLTRDRLVRDVTVTPDGDDCDATVTVASGVWSNTLPGDEPVVNMNDSGYFASYNVLLHEFGHAFSLADTYKNGRSGDCQPGQPQAVMCNTSFDKPQKDDVAGLTEKYQEAFPDDQPGPPADDGSTGALPPTGAATLSVQLFAALGASDAFGNVPLAFAATGPGVAADGVLSLCWSDAATCAATQSWSDLSPTDQRAGVPIYRLAPLTLSDGLTLTLRYRTAAGQATTTLLFRGGA